MKNPLIGAHLLLDVVVAPGAGCARVLRAPRALGPFLLLAAVSVGIHVASMILLEPAVRADALLADTLGGPGDAPRLFRAMEVGFALLAPLGILLRAGLLALILDATAAVLGCGRTGRSLWVWLIGIEIVLLLEQIAGVVALALDPPPSLEAVAAHGLHAGISLLHDFDSPVLAAIADAASCFSIWWAVLLAVGLARVARFRPRMAATLAAGCWLGVVGVRALATFR